MGLLDFLIKQTDSVLDTLYEGNKKDFIKSQSNNSFFVKERESIINSQSKFVNAKIDTLDTFFTKTEIENLKILFEKNGISKLNIIIYFTYYFLDHIENASIISHAQEKLRSELTNEEISSIFKGTTFMKYFTKENILNFKNKFNYKPNTDEDSAIAALKKEASSVDHTIFNLELAEKILSRYSQNDQLEILAICLYLNIWMFSAKREVFDNNKREFNRLCDVCYIGIDKVQERLNQMKLKN